MVIRVLIVGRHHLFHDGIIHLLGDQADLTVVGSVRSWDKACEIMLRDSPDVLIITLAQNKMVIHERQQVVDVTASEFYAIWAS